MKTSDKRFKIAVMICIVFGTLVVIFLPQEHITPFRMTVVSASSPVLSGSASIGTFFSNFFDGFGNAGKLRKENEQLKKENFELTNIIVKQQAELNEYKKTIQAILPFQNEYLLNENNLNMSFVVSKGSSKVIGQDASAWPQSFIIDRGKNAGIEPGMPVVWGNALVGKIATVGDWASQVQLMTDPDFTVWALKADNFDVQGIVQGTSGPACVMKYVSVGEDIAADDILITSGYADVFPQGIVVGTVKSEPKKGFDNYYEIDVEPRVDLKKLRSVIVLDKKPYLENVR